MVMLDSFTTEEIHFFLDIIDDKISSRPINVRNNNALKDQLKREGRDAVDSKNSFKSILPDAAFIFISDT